MKKKFLSAIAIAALLSLSSCKSSGSGSFETDVRKMADYFCKEQKLEAKDPTDESAKKELENLRAEMKAFDDKMEEKYKDKKGDKTMNDKAEVIMKEVMEKCK